MTSLRYPWRVALCAGLTTLLSCSSGDSPVAPTALSLNAVLVYPDGPQLATAAGIQPVTAIRVTVRESGTQNTLGETTIPVDPSAPEWVLQVPVPGSLGSAVMLTLDFELLNASDGVEWSGRAGPISPSRAATTLLNVDVFPGPLSNLSVVSIDLTGPMSVQEGDPFTVVATATTSDGSTPILYWSSTDETVLTVDGDGNGVAVGAGTASIRAQAGPVVATHAIEVTAAAPGSSHYSHSAGKTSS